MAVFAPEIGVLTAFKQYQEATLFASELSALRYRTPRDALGIHGMTLQEGNSSDSNAQREAARADVENGAPPPRAFSKTYGFYVVMGGLSIDVSHLHDRLDHVVLTCSGALFLARKGLFFEISDDEIHDKSKANTLAKGLVLLQLTWTILQCLSRKAVSLPLSILEVHILVHAGCALIMYGLWFNKPLGVDTSTKLTLRIPDETLALMLMQTHNFGHLPPPFDFEKVKLSGSRPGVWPPDHAAESTYLIFNPQYATSSAKLDDTPIKLQMHCDLGADERDLDPSTSHDLESSQEPLPQAPDHFICAKAECWDPSITPPRGTEIQVTLVSGECLPGGIGPNAYALGKWHRPNLQHRVPFRVKQVPEYLHKELPLDHMDPASIEYCCPLTVSLSKKDVRRWQLAGAALQRETTSKISCRFDSSGGTYQGSYFVTVQALLETGEGFVGDLLDSFGGAPRNLTEHLILTLKMYEAFANWISGPTLLPGLMYGALHTALWNYTFPSLAERLLWRISGIVLIAVPVLMSLIIAYRTICRRLLAPDSDPQSLNQDAKEENGTCAKTTSPATPINRASIGKIIYIYALYGVTALFGLLYVFARVFIIVESFISLRHVPIGVYSDVGWSKYIPHL
ncbi:MAG: hypothetical protein Q9220_003328 [cf. Caloplaca sp. 1 TL-2023]